MLDKNGNRVEVVYPGGVRALYSHDYADRETTLAVAVPGEPALPVVETASYLPMGPLGQLELGNGTTETHLFDERYYPQRITVAGAAALLDWQYTVDAEDNPTAITDLLSPAGSRSYSYQDFQYYLTLGNGPWGGLSWEYDRIVFVTGPATGPSKQLACVAAEEAAKSQTPRGTHARHRHPILFTQK